MPQAKQNKGTVKPEKTHGIGHIFDAVGYAWAGVKILLTETAIRLELGGTIFTLILFLAVGVEPLHFMIYIMMALVVLGFEGLNTAIEMIVDEISPEYSEFAKNTKDVASASVLMALLAAGSFSTYALFNALLRDYG